MSTSTALRSRIAGSVAWMAIGDALGMPSEFLTPTQIRQEYGAITGLRQPGRKAIHPDLRMGSVTDDTEQALYLVEGFCRYRRVSAETAAAALVRWATERDVWNKSYLGPSSGCALRRLAEGGDPHITGGDGSTVGAAMSGSGLAAARFRCSTSNT
ncbi:MAG: ADP-ribosylglycohydrolase family protein [Limnochordaceae bacterium]|nr:ADP-ribosylglycohydrolase family protein [Limnochordaceae bacterium]